MKKRIYLAMLAACLALTMTGCGESGKTGTDTAETQENTDGKTAEAGVSRLVSVDNVDKYITLGEYKGLILDNTVEVITDDDVQARIDQELQDKAEAVSDGAQEGDLVTVNYVGTIDGETFDGGTANNYDFIIGNGGMFQEFEQGVIGMKKGETKEISIDFPSDYSDSTLAGKKADYKVTVQNVRRAPELTDEWVTKNTDYTTVEEYREGTYKTLEKEARESAGEVLKNTAWNTVLENTEVKEYPEADVDHLDIGEIGPYFENHMAFPDRVNTEFVEVLDDHTLKMRVWERGSGETLACGTGACAVAVASILNGHVDGDKPVTVKLLGGDLEIFWDRQENLVYMTGPAATVFDGEIDLSFLE